MKKKKTALVTAGIVLGLVALWLTARSRRRRPDKSSPVPRSHEKQSYRGNGRGQQILCKPSRSFPSVLRSIETIEPMIPGSAAAALPANLARTRLRACKCFLIHSFKPPLSDGLGAGAGMGALPPPPVKASTIVLIAMPIAVRVDAMVIPCSRKS